MHHKLFLLVLKHALTTEISGDDGFGAIATFSNGIQRPFFLSIFDAVCLFVLKSEETKGAST